VLLLNECLLLLLLFLYRLGPETFGYTLVYGLIFRLQTIPRLAFMRDVPGSNLVRLTGYSVSAFPLFFPLLVRSLL